MLELFKLRTSHMFVSSRAITKRILKAEKDGEELYEAIEKNWGLLHNHVNAANTSKTLQTYTLLIDLIQEYFEKVAFAEEEHLMVYLFRVEEDIADIDSHLDRYVKAVSKVMSDYNTRLGRSKSPEVLLAKQTVQQFKDDIKSFVQTTHEDFKTIRNQWKEKEKLRDKLFFNFREEFNKNHAAKELKRLSSDETKFDSDILDLLQEAERVLKSIQSHLSDTPGSLSKKERLFKEKNQAIAKLLVKNKDLFNNMIGYTHFLLRYAVYHFFTMMTIQTKCLGVIDYCKTKGCWANALSSMNTKYGDLREWEERLERREYLTMKQLRTKTKKIK